MTPFSLALFTHIYRWNRETSHMREVNCSLRENHSNSWNNFPTSKVFTGSWRDTRWYDMTGENPSLRSVDVSIYWSLLFLGHFWLRLGIYNRHTFVPYPPKAHKPEVTLLPQNTFNSWCFSVGTSPKFLARQTLLERLQRQRKAPMICYSRRWTGTCARGMSRNLFLFSRNLFHL